MVISNYRRRNGNNVQYFCKTNMNIRVATTCGNTQKRHNHTFTFNHNCRMKNRSSNHIKYFSACGYPTWISSYSVKVSNADGAAIDISKPVGGINLS